MRKLMALLLALVLLLAAYPALGASVESETVTGEGEEGLLPLSPAEIALIGRPVSDTPTHITVGNTTKVSGFFFTGMWSNNTSDIDVRTLLHGYSTIVWNSQVEFIADPMVVEELTTGTARGIPSTPSSFRRI